jgi:REP element-mobilizing transposase RayT
MLYVQLRQYLGEVFRKLAEQKESRIEEGHLMPGHVHMMISIPPKYSVSQVIGSIEGKSALHLARVYGALTFPTALNCASITKDGRIRQRLRAADGHRTGRSAPVHLPLHTPLLMAVLMDGLSGLPSARVIETGYC